MSEKLLLWLQFLCSGWMTSLIWTIQLLHYPSFNFIEKKKIKDFSNFHQKKISLLVMPPMIIEIISLIFLIYINPENKIYQISTFLLGLIWASTLFLQVPCHHRLSQGDNKVIARLINSNWIRTTAWTIKSFLILKLLT